MKKIFIVMLVAPFLLTAFILQNHVQAANVDIAFAQKLIESNANSGETGYNFMINALNGFNDKELRELKRIIKNDMDTMAGKIVYPPTSLAEAALAGRVLHAIDERLGILQFDIVAEGKFTDFTGAGIAVSDYTFSGNDGYKLTNVAVSPATLMPYYGYQENFDDVVRIFLRRVTFTDTKITRHFVIKLVILEDNSSSPKKTLLPKSWSS